MKHPVPGRQWVNPKSLQKRPTALPVFQTQNSPSPKLNGDFSTLTPSKQWVVGSNPSRDAFSFKKTPKTTSAPNRFPNLSGQA